MLCLVHSICISLFGNRFLAINKWPYGIIRHLSCIFYELMKQTVTTVFPQSYSTHHLRYTQCRAFNKIYNLPISTRRKKQFECEYKPMRRLQWRRNQKSLSSRIVVWSTIYLSHVTVWQIKIKKKMFEETVVLVCDPSWLKWAINGILLLNIICYSLSVYSVSK